MAEASYQHHSSKTVVQHRCLSQQLSLHHVCQWPQRLNHACQKYVLHVYSCVKQLAAYVAGQRAAWELHLAGHAADSSAATVAIFLAVADQLQ
jgi:hypothetical protein